MSTPTSSPVQTGSAYPTALNYRFNASMAIIVVVLVTTFFFLGLFVLYVRRCNRDSDARADGSLQRAYWREREGVGVEPEMVQKLPLMRFASVKGRKKGKVGFECVVCLVEFEEEEKLKLLPTCGHSFHPQCIDMWLQSHTTCPLCRFSLVPLESASPDPNLQADPQPVETGEPQDQTIPVTIIRTLSRNSESFKRAVQNLEHSPLRKSDTGSPSTPKLPPRSPLSAEESLRRHRMILLRSGLSRSVGHNSIANRPNWAEISEFATKHPSSGAGSVIINIDPVVGERTRNWGEVSGLPATPEHFEEEEAEKHSGFSFKRTFSLRRSSSDGKTIFTSNARLFIGDQSAPTPQSPALQDNKFIPALTKSLKKLVGKDFPQTSPARP